VQLANYGRVDIYETVSLLYIAKMHSCGRFICYVVVSVVARSLRCHTYGVSTPTRLDVIRVWDGDSGPGLLSFISSKNLLVSCKGSECIFSLSNSTIKLSYVWSFLAIDFIRLRVFVSKSMLHLLMSYSTTIQYDDCYIYTFAMSYYTTILLW
jgi:hypothetical protein